MKDVYQIERIGLPAQVNFPVCLAPMVGLSHVGMRLVVRRYLPKMARTLWPTEMLNSRRLPSEDLDKTPETMKSQNETDLVPQILGNEEKYIEASIKKLVDWGAVGIDINMGCPVKKALKHNYGVALMGDSSYASEVVRMAVRHSQVPVSVKLRAGQKEEQAKFLDFLRGIQDAGASWITLHPRFAHEMRRGAADWQKIAEAREALNIPVVGNGDIQTAEDVFAMLRESHCDLVMAGRALTARPWLMWQVGEKLGFENPVGLQGSAPNTPYEEGAEYGRMLLHLLEELELRYPKDLALRKIKFFVRTGSPWLEYGHTLNAAISKCQSFDQMREMIAQFFAVPQKMMSKTDLRT